MADKNAIIKLGVDICKNQVNTEFASGTREEQMEILRKALVEANGGSTKLSYKSMRNNVELFEIIETILEMNVFQGFEDNDFFEQFVEYRNLALGDEIISILKTIHYSRIQLLKYRFYIKTKN